jgi:hypothetical protein
MQINPNTREEWLMVAVEKLRPIFAHEDAEIPPLKVTNGWPASGGRGVKRRRIGECWDAESTEDGKAQIFISPMLDDPAEVLATLVHELVHAVVGCKANHRKPFTRLAFAIGLLPPATSTVASFNLSVKLKAIAEEIGKYPHAKILLKERKGPAQQTLFKATCPECGYNCRLLYKWASEVGAPLCPTHKTPLEFTLPDRNPIKTARERLDAAVGV